MDCPHSTHKSLLEAKEAERGGERRVMVDEALQAAVVINPPQVRSRKGRWLRKRQKQAQFIARVKHFEGRVWLLDFSVPTEDHTIDVNTALFVGNQANSHIAPPSPHKWKDNWVEKLRLSQKQCVESLKLTLIFKNQPNLKELWFLCGLKCSDTFTRPASQSQRKRHQC